MNINKIIKSAKGSFASWGLSVPEGHPSLGYLCTQIGSGRRRRRCRRRSISSLYSSDFSTTTLHGHCAHILRDHGELLRAQLAIERESRTNTDCTVDRCSNTRRSYCIWRESARIKWGDPSNHVQWCFSLVGGEIVIAYVHSCHGVQCGR